MYYVMRAGDTLDNYHYIFSGEDAQIKAMKAALNLKHMYGHQYEVVKVETVWHTQTLAELLEEERT